MRNLVSHLMTNNKVINNNTDEYTKKETFWSMSVSEYHTLILKSGIILSKQEILSLYAQARGLFFIPMSGLRNYTSDSICNIIISLHLGADLKTDESVFFGMKWIYK